MATCGIASGAKPIMDFFVDELDKRGIGAVVTQTGCMGYCYAEPTVEVQLPGRSLLFTASLTGRGLMRSLRNTSRTVNWLRVSYRLTMKK
jgi:hypothetical protein